MAVGLQSNKGKAVKKTARRKPVESKGLTASQETLASHVAGTLAQREPDDNAHRPHEAPESASRSSEAPDAGFARCTEFSDFSHRGRDWS